MAGEPYHFPCPSVFGVKLVGELPPWVSARDVILELLRRHGVKGRVRMELDNIDTIKTAVASGAGISILPRSAVRDDENGVSLHVLRLADAQFLRPIYLIYNRSRKLSPSAKSFMGIFDAPKKIPAGRC